MFKGKNFESFTIFSIKESVLSTQTIDIYFQIRTEYPVSMMNILKINAQTVSNKQKGIYDRFY